MKRIQFTDCIELVGNSCSYYEGEKKYISTGTIAVDKIEADKVEVVSYENKPSRANLIVEKNTIIFAKMQDTKKTLLIDAETEQYVFSTGFCAVKPKESVINARCLYHLLMSKMFLEQKDENCSGATQKAITNAGLNKIIVTIPPLEIQASIAEQLDKIQSIIDIRQSELSHLDDLIKARFVELFGDPYINDRNWIVDTLGNYMTTLTDFSANGSYELLDSNVVMYDEPNYAVMVRTTDLESGDLNSGVKYIDKSAYELLNKSKLFGGELIMNKIGSAGKIYIMPYIDKPASLGRNAFMFRFDDRLNMKYLYFLLSSDYGTNEIQQYVRGAVTKTITKDSTRAIKIVVPPIELQNQFAAFVEQTDKSKFAVQKSLEETQLLFDSLMQKYFG